jgi:hypothetical protein
VEADGTVGADWLWVADCYLRHPLASWLAARLAWTLTPTDGSPAVRGFPDPATGGVRTPAGMVAVPPGCLVQLVHPVALAAGELAALRRPCQHLEITQPVRQLWRETYRLTAAERDTGLYTERYAGHILRFAQAYGLARRHGWGRRIPVRRVGRRRHRSRAPRLPRRGPASVLGHRPARRPQ